MSFNPYDKDYLTQIDQRKQSAAKETEIARFTLDANQHHGVAIAIATLAGSKTMTKRQYDALSAVVKYPDKEGNVIHEPGPMVKWDTEPDYQDYIRALPAIMETHKRRITVNNLINYARGSHWKKIGYFAWKAAHGTQGTSVVVSNEPDSSIFDY
jgi:hypothetical protein